jgi:hypothetical protein
MEGGGTAPAVGLDRLAFLHVPKTAGTSLTQVLASHWGRVRIVGRFEELRDTPPDGLADITLFAGHVFAYQLDHPALAGFAPVTVLRDPLARLVSEYRFARACAEQGRPLTALMRYATRTGFFEYAFCGECAWGRHAQLFILGLPDGQTRPLAVPQAELLERARRRLETFRAVGLTEALEPFVSRLFAEAGATPPPSLPHLLDQGDPEEIGLTAAQTGVLREVLAPDYALHDHARALMLRWLDGGGGPVPPRAAPDHAAAAPLRRAAVPAGLDLVQRLQAMPGPIAELQKLCDAADWADPRLPLTVREMLGLRPRLHPRLWECGMAALALALSGRLDRGARAEGLCLGAAAEALVPALTRRSARLVHGVPGPGDGAGGRQPLDLRHLAGLPDASFDYACSIAALGEFAGEGEVLEHLGAVRRVLRPGGLYALTAELRLGARSHLVPGNLGLALDDLLRLVREAGLHPGPRIDMRLADLGENDPRDLPSMRHYDPAQEFGLTLTVREEGGLFLAPVLLLLRKQERADAPVVVGLEATVARLHQAYDARVEWRGRDWVRLNPWGFWATPQGSAWNDLRGGQAPPPEEDPASTVFATGYQSFGAGEVEVQVVLSPSPRVADAGPAVVEVLVSEWAREDLAALRPCLRQVATVNEPAGAVAVLRFRLPVDAGCRYAILGQRVSGRPLVAAVDVQLRRAPEPAPDGEGGGRAG